MKVSIKLSDKDVRELIYSKVVELLPEEVLDQGYEVYPEIYATEYHDSGHKSTFDLSDPYYWSIHVNVKINNNELTNKLDEESLD